MIQARIQKNNLEIFTDNIETARIIQEKLSCFEINYQHQTLYRMGKSDGRKKFYNVKKSSDGWFFATDLGFTKRIENSFDIEILEDKDTKNPEALEFLKREIPKLPFKPYKHQLSLFMGLINSKNHLGISSVGSGKSLSIYLTLLWLRQNSQGNKKIILLVPTIMLVQQIFNDFKSYNAQDDFLNDIQQIGGDFTSKDIIKPIVISTWQSAVKTPLKGFDVCMVDEAHRSKASVLDSIIKNNNFSIKFGLTGSMPIIEYDAMILESNFGEPVRYINAKKMMEMGLATDLTIVAIFLNYPKVPLNLIKKYPDEIKYMKSNTQRKDFINKFMLKLTGITVGLYAHTVFGIDTWERLTGEKLTTKIKNSLILQKELGVFFISGSTKPSLREEIRLYLNTPEASTAIVIAQFNILSTGINIPKLKNLVYLNANKSFTDTLQSIGRVLRLHDSKLKAYVFDLVDCMSGNRKEENYLLKHFWERNNYYQQEGFNVIEKEINL